MMHDDDHAIKLIQQQHPSQNQKAIWSGGYPYLENSSGQHLNTFIHILTNQGGHSLHKVYYEYVMLLPLGNRYTIS